MVIQTRGEHHEVAHIHRHHDLIAIEGLCKHPVV
jgi:hypothetical protein